MVCQNHDSLVAKIDALNDKIDHKFELMTESILKQNEKLCKSIIDLNNKKNSNQTQISKSAFVMITAIVSAVCGAAAGILQKYM